ncbi:hypothetical protein EV196_103177 [Mariniflexile fucanivorans]|uniref:PepSY-associated transmembrane protein n=1 Tax=Mariniflexile fucanivorans TaxID=264023 RepID=A0A4R1RKN3_9FLAO|nr:hypothetical protein [Mariniflexile fucanivorans]TCL66761.1 hypothetical protein EV196_103177 [Mariniflexile fucanivorans]
MKPKQLSTTVRVIHRYLGFFLAGIMAIYAISGILLIFRDTDFLKSQHVVEKKIPGKVNLNKLGNQLKIKNLSIDKVENDIAYFKEGTFNTKTGVANYTTKSLPFVLDKMTKLHKSNSSQPLFFLNVFFGVSLLFFVLSSFWMYLPKTTIFKKGMYFTLGGVVLALILIFV